MYITVIYLKNNKLRSSPFFLRNKICITDLGTFLLYIYKVPLFNLTKNQVNSSNLFYRLFVEIGILFSYQK